jgi:hypothetical protein
LSGEKELIHGGAIDGLGVGVGLVIEKLLELVVVPPGVVTLIVPLEAPLGTVAVTWLDELTANDAVVPLNVTAMAPVKPEPLIVTVVPALPLPGENEVIDGAWVELVIEKLLELAAVPPDVVTLIFPLEAPLGTVAVT